MRGMRIGMFAAAVAATALLAVLTPAQAQSASPVAATAVHQCNILTASHRNQGSRVLSSVETSKVHVVCTAVRKSSSVLNYFAHKGRWQVAPRYKRWWQVPGTRWRRVVRSSRALMRWHTHRLGRLERRLQGIMPAPHLVHDQLYQDFLCIHTGLRNGIRVGSGEGAWNAVATYSGTTYYGGLQMDYGFMQSYGPQFLARWGTADKWPAWAQIKASIEAYQSGRGFSPWPNTARDCGLL